MLFMIFLIIKPERILFKRSKIWVLFVYRKVFSAGLYLLSRKKDLIENLKRITGENESVYLILACQKCFGKVTIIGRGFDKEYVANDLESMVL